VLGIDYDIKKGTNQFYIGVDEEHILAQIRYYYNSETAIVIDHTFVSEELRGGPLAGNLLEEVVQFARKNNLKIIPDCSYAVKKLTRNNDYKDILYQD